MISADEVRVLDLNSAWHGVPTSHLMQNAGRAVADAALKFHQPKRVLVLCGQGNNGGDGAVAAKALAEAGVRVVVLYAADPATIKSGDARNAFHALDARAIRLETYRSPQRVKELARSSDLVVDGLLGVGVSGELREPIRSIVKAVNATRTPVLAIDVPTGLGGRQGLRATTTVTLHDRKPGMDATTGGRILTRPIGIPEAASGIGPGDLAVHYPTRDPSSHKGQNGRVLILAGGPYCGAPLLSAMAALRAGCDLVRLYTPRACAQAARAHAPDLIVHEGVEEHRLVLKDLERIGPLLAKVDAVLIGPGLGMDRPTQEFVKGALEVTQRRRLALVIDADAHTLAGRHPTLLGRRPVICTPHAREFKDLTRRPLPKEAPALEAAVAHAAKRLRVTLLLKGPTDVVSDGRRTKPNTIHHPWMTAGGTGDVLAGLNAALLSKGMDPFHAAAASAFLNGAAGLRAFDEKNWGARATDLIEAVPIVLRDWIPPRASTPTLY